MHRLAIALIAIAFFATSVAARGTPPPVTGTIVAPVATPKNSLILPTLRNTRQILFFGDSITDYYGYPTVVSSALDLVRINYRPNDPNRAAIGGTSLILTVKDYGLRVAPYPLDKLVVFYGTNDFYLIEGQPASFSLTDWTAAWDSLYAQVDHTRIKRVIVVGLPYLTGLGRPMPFPITSFRGQMDTITENEAAAHGATYVSLDAMTAAMLQSDGIHPNASGQALIAQSIIAAAK